MSEQTALIFAGVNALLNGISAVFLALGWVFIRGGKYRKHAICMIAAVVVSTAFLASYLYLHFNKGYVTRFPDLGWIRAVYLVILLTHTVLAAFVPPLALITVVLAAMRRWRSHRRVARWTLPIWLYVSVTGVVIYLMLYHLAPRLAG